jgi:PAS domain S-box-containing protein
MKLSLSNIGINAGVAALYFLLGKLGLLPPLVDAHAALFWLPAGPALAAILLLGRRACWGVFLGALMVALTPRATGGAPFWGHLGAALGIAFGQVLQAATGAWLVERWARGRQAFKAPHTIFRFVVLGAGLSTTIGPTLGLASVLLAKARHAGDVEATWLTWWLGGAISAMVITPLIMTWSERPARLLRPKKLGELGTLLLLFLVVCQLSFGGWVRGSAQGVLLCLFVIPLLLWSALRFGPHVTVAVVMLLSCVAVSDTLHGGGPFALSDRNASLMMVQVFLGVISLLALVLATMAAQRAHAEAALRASERRYRELFESTPQPMWVYDYASLRFRAVNNAAVAHYGYSAEEFLGLRVTDLGLEEDRPQQLDEIGKARAGLPAIRQWRHRKKDGTVIDVEIVSHNLVLEGRPCAVVVSTDISQRLQTEREILRLNAELEERVRARTEQLEATNKELEAFAYSVSHDLRAPLRSARGFNEVLLERYGNRLGAEGREFLQRAYDSCSQMDRLIEDLLKLSRVGRSELVKGMVDLSGLADRIAADLRQAEPRREVEVAITPGLTACGDERLLRIALDNLLRNAWKFTRDQPRPRIEFGSMPDQPPAFFVRDNGAGFDMTYAERLFGVFQRLHTANEFPGTGVGLATVKRIINRHGGRAWAVGAVSHGATFFFTLPANGYYREQPGAASPRR